MLRPITRAAVAAGAAASMVLLLTSPGASADQQSAAGSAEMAKAAGALFPGFAAISDSRTLDVPALLEGTLTTAAGAPMAGAQVLLSAWPSNQSVGALPVGGAFSITPIARTLAGRNGTYELRSALTPLLNTLTDKEGLDLELDVFHGGRHYVYLTQVEPDRAVGGWLRATAMDAAGRATAAVRNPMTLDLAFSTGQGTPLPRAVSGSPGDRPATDPMPGVGCTRYEKHATKLPYTTVATAAARKGVRAEVTYQKTANTEVSTGISYDGGASFSISGSRSRSSSFSPTWKKNNGKKTFNREYKLQMETAVLKRKCVGNGYSNNGPYKMHYVTSPVGLTGGGKTPQPSRYPLWKCGPEGNKRTTKAGYANVATEDARAATYQAAFGFKPTGAGGFTGSALSGYSDTVKVTYHFKHPNRAFWCGHTSFPLHDGQRVQGFETKK